ncbi:DUF4394 domain-containing protein [Sphingomonas glaciei]|uniref:DUF4394 domain-containing protein n=1 Tax=Sphingomonas glaciei TaxID=2938948 RepID=A0ABY5MSV7_9SPHN|nr:DUF4394 domain-containing protein [Sphingomonas glaciei]UUR06810.1 DUF4394 domain-containing protein [Sphingomonas glaciei]
MRHVFAASLLITASLAAAPASAETVFGLTSSRIVTFDTSSPGTVLSSSPITGLTGNVSLRGIDFRPADGQLYALGTNGNLYRLTLNGNTYQAADLGALSTQPQGSSFGFDFNPTVDRIRVTSDTNQNLRLNQTTTPPGVTVDGAITLNGSSNVDLLGSAYTNSFAEATSTTLYGLDAFTDALVRSTDANAGTYVSTNTSGVAFGPLGVTFGATDQLGFDISGITNGAFFNLNDGFYSVNLTTGAATRIGTIGAGSLIGLSLAPAAAVPEPGTWAMMLLGFGAIGATMRRRRSVTAKLAQMA